eukprot:11769009-Ditylum_brightwellii.AAC.1
MDKESGCLISAATIFRLYRESESDNVTVRADDKHYAVVCNVCTSVSHRKRLNECLERFGLKFQRGDGVPMGYSVELTLYHS